VYNQYKEVDDMRKIVSFLAGLLAGAVVGAAAAILLAPYSGSELQEQVRSRVQGLVEEGRRAAAARRAELEAQLEAFKRGTPVTIETTPEEAQT
jgi:gas vesicle protein